MSLKVRARREDVLVAIIVAAIGAIVAISMGAQLVRDFGTAGTLFSMLGLPMTVAVFWAARRLYGRALRAKVAALRREDGRNMELMASTVSLCRALALGAWASRLAAAAAMPAMLHIADRIGTARAMHGYLLTDAGRQAAEGVHEAALSAIADQGCSPADISDMLVHLWNLGGEMRDIDSEALARRRVREAGAEDPVPE